MSAITVTHIFKVTPYADLKVYRMIEMLGTQTLDDFHRVILEEFDLDYDHLYSFFMNNKAWSGVNNEYCDPRSNGRHADKIKIGMLRLIPKQKFLYLFDYGDELKFEVKYIGTGETEKNEKYPRIIESVGKAPKQYDYDEE